jgi:hypothetical protein
MGERPGRVTPYTGLRAATAWVAKSLLLYHPTPGCFFPNGSPISQMPYPGLQITGPLLC